MHNRETCGDDQVEKEAKTWADNLAQGQQRARERRQLDKELSKKLFQIGEWAEQGLQGEKHACSHETMYWRLAEVGPAPVKTRRSVHFQLQPLLPRNRVDWQGAPSDDGVEGHGLLAIAIWKPKGQRKNEQTFAVYNYL